VTESSDGMVDSKGHVDSKILPPEKDPACPPPSPFNTATHGLTLSHASRPFPPRIGEHIWLKGMSSGMQRVRQCLTGGCCWRREWTSTPSVDALAVAAMYGHARMVRVLLEKGADIRSLLFSHIEGAFKPCILLCPPPLRTRIASPPPLPVYISHTKGNLQTVLLLRTRNGSCCSGPTDIPLIRLGYGV
jgi:hypothetical protein